jgi:hypothetical protein
MNPPRALPEMNRGKTADLVQIPSYRRVNLLRSPRIRSTILLSGPCGRPASAAERRNLRLSLDLTSPRPNFLCFIRHLQFHHHTLTRSPRNRQRARPTLSQGRQVLVSSLDRSSSRISGEGATRRGLRHE